MRMSNWGQRTLQGAMVLAIMATAAQAGSLHPLDPLVRAAAPGKKATASVFVAAARAGDRLVVGGERGVVLLSDDQGQSWRQAKVPVSVTLTGLSFPSAAKGWAVGHSGVILSTTDGGLTWQKQLDSVESQASHTAAAAGSVGSENPGDPLLDVYFKDESNGWAVGAFGRALRTSDGGRTWSDGRSRIPNPDGSHLYAVRSVGANLYVVGERGAIFVSRDGGERFVALKSPYEGSWFGLAAAPGGGVLVFGLRGHLFRSSDEGQSWLEIKLGSGNAWLGSAGLPDGSIVLVNQAGEVAHGTEDGKFQVLAQRLPPLAAVTSASNQTAVAVGLGGLALVPMSTKSIDIRK